MDHIPHYFLLFFYLCRTIPLYKDLFFMTFPRSLQRGSTVQYTTMFCCVQRNVYKDLLYTTMFCCVQRNVYKDLFFMTFPRSLQRGCTVHCTVQGGSGGVSAGTVLSGVGRLLLRYAAVVGHQRLRHHR
eukprot:TRINITY_DN59062_c1_g2_i3.p1 TRINITY_DN59062_c1_g2~~TRINITY_DN59062_c1_g2_i3.p1  ORF type:complete len:129 (-),score=9.76 TRINITY_DN59062_c1_g2_i3:89-475(-)